MLKLLNPTTPSQRHRKIISKNLLSNKSYFQKLIKGFKRSFGKNNQGRITSKHRGGGHKRLYRRVSFNRTFVSGSVKSIEYDPNRTCYIAAIENKNDKYYILAPVGLSCGDCITSGPNSKISLGNALPLKNIPIGNYIHNIGLYPGKGGQLMRSAGTFGQLLQKTFDNKGKIRLSSGQQCTVSLDVFASLGIVSNLDNNKKKLGKAGCSRWLNRRPKVRGVAKNPVDHPHGGGEGKTSGGRPSVSFKGRITKGGKSTRKQKKNVKK